MNAVYWYDLIRSIITIVASVVLMKYYLYLVLAPFYSVQVAWRSWRLKHKINRGEAQQIYEPLVSIIIPCWNESVGILNSVYSVLKSKYRNIEVLVINDGSTDNTEEVIKNFLKTYDQKSQFGPKIYYFKQKNLGKGAALNHGVYKAKGEIIVTMDADSIYRDDAIQNIVNHFQDPYVDALVGNVTVAHNESIIGRIQELEYIFGFYFKRVHSLFSAEYIFGGACAAFRKSTTFDKIGLFDEKHKTEDIEYSMRTQMHGLHSIYAEDVVVYTEGASDIRSLYNQRLRWKKGRMDTFWQYRKLFFSRKKKHSTFLSWVVLPYAVLSEAQLLVEPVFFAVVWTYTLLTGDFLSVGLSSLFIFFTFLTSLVFGAHKQRAYYLLLFPAFWLLFYILVSVEFFALLQTIELIFQGRDIKWQKWERKGVQI